MASVVIGQAREKGFDFTLRAFAKLRNRRDDFHLSFIGEGPELAELQALAEQLFLKDYVTFYGYIKSYQYMIQELAQFDALIFSSLPVLGSNFRDTQATVMQEAMLMGAVVVASNIGGIPESLPTIFHRYLYTPGSADELADRLCSLMTNSGEELRSLGRTARHFVEENYDIRIINERILAKIASASSPP